MSIIIGTDFSEASRQALHVAASISASLADPLIIVNVVDPMRPLQPIPLTPIVETARDSVRLGAHVAQGLGARAEEVVLVGAPHDEIASLALARGARLVVVGSSERPGALFSIGGTAERLVRSSPVPVLIVRDGRRLTSWARAREPLRVMVGSEIAASSNAPAAFLDVLRGIGPVDAILAHIYSPRAEAERLGMHGKGREPEIEAILDRDLCHALGERHAPGRLVMIASDDDPGVALARAASSEGIDLLVMGSHQRHGFALLTRGSESRAALHHAPMSVACVPLSPWKPAVGTAPVQRVMAATDLSPLGDLGVRRATSVVPPGAELHVCTVLHPDDPRSDDDVISDLRARVPALGPERQISLRTHVVREADAARGICQLGERLGVDLICIGSHGRTGLSRILLGSVAQGVMRRSARPVLVVRELPAGDAEVLAAGAVPAVASRG